jgi:hypothetical protein
MNRILILSRNAEVYACEVPLNNFNLKTRNIFTESVIMVFQVTSFPS